MPELVLSVQDAMVTFGGKPLFEELSFNLHEGDRICLVGKNGAGKTTLMHIITATRELDQGKRWQLPGSTIGYLQQDVKPQVGQKVYDYIFSGLPKDQQNDDYRYKVDMMLGPFELHGDDRMEEISGGQLRRAALARALVEEPDILLLDEPTNHLDLEGIEWLEGFLRAYRGTFLCVSHDKTFLANISNKVFWLDRGRIRVCPRGFGYFEEWSQMLLEHEEAELRNRQKLVAQEVEWASRGIKARRKRNIRRVEQMKLAREKLKADMGSFRKAVSKIELQPLKGELSTRVIAEFYNVHKSFEREGRKVNILEKFNMRIMKGDRIGILGKNGSGKTTFLKLLLKELAPDMGKVKLAKHIDIAYFDQKRRDLDDTATLWETLCPNGGEYVEVMGKPRHVCGYLKDFMFDPKTAKDRVGTLSGGQKNRLMLARVLANPGGLLILDEPTNDLDMDTLDMLEEALSKFQGTLFVVSHDRDFLDQTVTQVLAFEGDANVEGYVGGYSDYLVKSGKGKPVKSGDGAGAKAKSKASGVKGQEESKAPPTDGLTNKERYELKKLPDQIAKLETKLVDLHAQLADPELYNQDKDKFFALSEEAGKFQQQLEQAEERWLELEEKQE